MPTDVTVGFVRANLSDSSERTLISEYMQGKLPLNLIILQSAGLEYTVQVVFAPFHRCSAYKTANHIASNVERKTSVYESGHEVRGKPKDELLVLSLNTNFTTQKNGLAITIT